MAHLFRLTIGPQVRPPEIRNTSTIEAVKTLLALFFAACLLAAAAGQDHEGNFVIRFEPSAVLQTNVEVPFDIHVNDDRHRPVDNATVTLQIETPDHHNVKVFKAGTAGSGAYKAKPLFPFPGTWSIYVEVHLNGQMSARTIDFNVPASAS